ncbi:metalloprotease TldD [Herbaspirillum camelliae]|uniref:metalloprotease TldD n=1 Tax=Herbaspirillum camelliae TaxID=1892903 RepID=UPI000949CC31|nr:metalloprotease TldD [Herbaspirillum camelliae]
MEKSIQASHVSINVSALAIARAGLMTPYGLDETHLFAGLRTALSKGGDFADLYVKSSEFEHWALEGGRVNRGRYDQDLGFGLRVLHGDQSLLATASSLDLASIMRAADAVSSSRAQAASPVAAIRIEGGKKTYYAPLDPLLALSADGKISLLETVNALARAYDSRVVEVNASLSLSRDLIMLARYDGFLGGDVRPLIRLDLTVQVMAHGRRESASRALGGRSDPAAMDEPRIRQLVKETVDAALVKLDARATPAGTMNVVIGPGWNGVLLHEAIGHGLEGDFNRRGSSAFSGRIGERVAARGVTIVDDATVIAGRGSLNMDDEGVPGQCTTLVEDGILKGYMQDILNARLMQEKSTGNGRRQSYDVLPMPRMTNTYMCAGDVDPDEIIASVRHGIYIASLGGGQVDISSGRFMFSASEAFLIEAGRLTAPLKGATVVGDGADALTHIKLVGNDLQIDLARGVCIKQGQSLPVGVGQPTLRIDSMTVGGTA